MFPLNPVYIHMTSVLTAKSLLTFPLPTQGRKKKRCKSQKIQIKWCTRPLTPKLSSSTRKTLSRTARGSTISSSTSAVNLGVTNSCVSAKDDGHWTCQEIVMMHYELIVFVKTLSLFVKEIPAQYPSVQISSSWTGPSYVLFLNCQPFLLIFFYYTIVHNTKLPHPLMTFK